MPRITSSKQAAANRANARNSTGPATPEGKQKSRLNGLTHGLRTSDVVLTVGRAAEDPEAYQSLLNSMLADFRPKTALERGLIERLAVCFWRSRRALRLEQSTLFDAGLTAQRESQLQDELHAKENDLEKTHESLRMLTEFLAIARPVAPSPMQEPSDPGEAHLPSHYLAAVAKQLDLRTISYSRCGLWRNTMERIDAALDQRRRHIECLQAEIPALRDRLTSLRAMAGFGSIPDAPSLASLMRYETTNDRQLHRILYQLLGKRKGPLQWQMEQLQFAHEKESMEDPDSPAAQSEHSEKNDI